MTNISCCSIPVLPVAEKAGWTYTEAMYHLCDMISRRLNPDAVARASYARILDNCHEVEAVRDRLAPQLRHKQQCRSAVDRLQYFAIRLHTSFVVSVCCRPALRRSNPKDGPNALTAQQRRTLAEKCKDNLTETVRMFLAMHQLSVIPTRSWAFTYHGLSSAVLLGILGETNADPEVRQLQGDLIAALSAAAAKEAQQPSPAPHIQKTDRDIELSGPLSRALMALRNIYDHGSIVGTVKLEVANGGSGSSVVGHGSLPGSGARTPLAGGGGGGANTPQLGGSARGAAAGGGGGGGGGGPVAAQGLAPMGPGQQQLDPHHNAALAMAEMQAQTGTGMQEFSG